MTAVSERFINNHVYPVVIYSGNGGRQIIYSGEVVEGSNFSSMVDVRRGLLPYNGPRQKGLMINVGNKPNQSTPRQSSRKSGGDIIPGLVSPRVEGALCTEKIPSSSSQEKYLGKTPQEWAKQSLASNFSEMTRGQIMGLSQFLGLNIVDNASKQDAINCVVDNLRLYAGTEKTKTNK
jgi:hypothetical protein